MKKQILSALLVVFLLSGCGFKPLYGSRGGDGGSPVEAQLNSIAIDNIPNREGQILRNNLIDRLYAQNRPAVPAYRLKVVIRSKEQELGLLANASATRALIDMYGDYSLVDSKGNELVSGTTHSVASFNKMDQMYGTVAARQNAYERTLNEIGEQIVNRLGLYFSERG